MQNDLPDAFKFKQSRNQKCNIKSSQEGAYAGGQVAEGLGR